MAGIALAVVYVAAVGFFAIGKAASMPGLDRLSWPEVIYGPAITVASTFLLLLGATKIEDLIRSRKGSS